MFLPVDDFLNAPIYFFEVQFQPDKRFYHRFFGEIFLYLSKYERSNNWSAVVIFKKRGLDPGNFPQYIELLTSQRVRRIYLDELEEAVDQLLGVGIIKLVVCDSLPQKRVRNYSSEPASKARSHPDRSIQVTDMFHS